MTFGMTHLVIYYELDVEIKSHFRGSVPMMMRLRTRSECEDSIFHYNIILVEYFNVFLYRIEWKIVRRNPPLILFSVDSPEVRSHIRLFPGTDQEPATFTGWRSHQKHRRTKY